MERGRLQLYGTIQDVKNTSLGGISWFCLETEGCFFLSKWPLNRALEDEQEERWKRIYSENSKYTPVYTSSILPQYPEVDLDNVSLIEVREKKGQDEAGSAGWLCRILGYTRCFSDDLEAVET